MASLLLMSVVMCGLLLTVTTGPAAAHDPIFLTADQTSPETGPYLPDGTISFALYGTLQEAGDTRGFEFDLREGDDLYLSLLIPDIEPEISIADDLLPTIELIEPDGTTRSIAPDRRDAFAEPFSRTNYITLFETVEPATGGRYQVVVSGDTPSRFTVAVGTSEEFFTVVERTVDKPGSFPEIASPLGVWYSTPAGEAPPTDAEGSVDMDMEMLDEALSDGDAVDATEADAEVDEAAPDDLTAEPDTSGEAAESEEAVVASEPEPEADDESDSAALAVDGDATADADGGGLGFVAPVVLIAAVGAAGAFLLRRRSS